MPPTAADYPKTPHGYRPPTQFQYPMLILNIGGVGILILAYLGFGWFMQQGRGTAPYTLSLTLLEILLIVASLPLTIILHELIHGITYRWLGYKVSYGFSAQHGAAYAAAFGQFQKRGHNMIAAVMPLVVITAFCTPLLNAESGFIATLAFTMLLVNTSGAVGDMYIIGRLLRMPRHTLLYDVSITTMLIFEPETPT